MDLKTPIGAYWGQRSPRNGGTWFSGGSCWEACIHIHEAMGSQLKLRIEFPKQVRMLYPHIDSYDSYDMLFSECTILVKFIAPVRLDPSMCHSHNMGSS